MLGQLLLAANVSAEEDVVIKLAAKVVGGSVRPLADGVTCVSNELSLRHLVFDVWARQIHGEQDQRETHHVHCIWKRRTLVQRLLVVEKDNTQNVLHKVSCQSLHKTMSWSILENTNR